MEDDWWRLSTTPTYDPHRIKGTILRSSALKYIHFILSHTLTRRRDSAGVISHRDFNFLLSMIDGFHLHLGYEVVVSISHQGTDPHIGALLVSPYITCLIRRMGIMEGVDRMRVVSDIAPMTLETLRPMGMLQHVITTRGLSTTFVSSLILHSQMFSTYPLPMLLSLHLYQQSPPHDKDQHRHPVLIIATQTKLLAHQQCSGGFRGVWHA